MNKIKKVCIIIVILTLIMSATGCNTYAGAGKDIERTGESMQD